MSLLDRIVPASALRWGALTRPWPQLDLWVQANPAIGVRVDPAALWGEHDRQAEDRP
ncbi:MAG TPA: hypothetical protein VFK52_00220 [Nocardioidaceae bacterium]|nr:hypothetical protein [Nocardioidaceae bacterium]